MQGMKVLLVYPRHSETFWSFRYALKFVAKKAAYPPLGLLTVAAMLPEEWEKKLVDVNVNTLADDDITWADYVFVSAMSIQRKSADEVISRCNRLGVKVVAGGPLFTTGYDEFPGVSHFVLGEAETTLPDFLADLEKGCARHIYASEERPDITKTPIPLWELLNMKDYAGMSVQYSRGCPFDCEFCDIVVLNGRRPRTKSKDQLLAEMDILYKRGWRGGLFLVDDNFIGNKVKLKSEILPAVVKWMEGRKYPFGLYTQASLNLADDEELMDLMARAGFETVFIGIETPDDDSLGECGKNQNRGRDMVACVTKIQNHGLQVQGGFIVGFDNDSPSIFERQINFIQNSGIVAAMVSLLSAPRGTKLYQRLKKENRLLMTDMPGDCPTTNFIPKMNSEILVKGYHKVLNTIYSPKEYYERVGTLLKEYRPRRRKVRFSLHFDDLQTFAKIVWALGIRESGRRHYWKLVFSTLLRYPRKFRLSMALAVHGFHFRKVAEEYNKTLAASSLRRIPQVND